jgi:iron complex transport system substrate-binding protein
MSRAHAPLAVLLTLAAVAAGTASADPIVITDHEKRTVTLAKPAQRIASIPIPMASTIITMDGGTGRLVGMNPTAKSAIMEGILGKIYPGAKDIPSDITAPNFIPNVEELAATNPDLVVQWADRGADLVDPITNAGLTAMLISYGTEEKTKQYQAMVATAMGKPERAAMINGWRDRVAAEMAETSKTIPADKKPRVLYLQRALGGMLASGAKGNYNTFYIELGGGISASATLEGNGVAISAEQVAEWNPDVILLNSFEARLDINWVYNDPILSLTNAAKDHKVYKMPLGGYRWDPPNQESPLTWMWIADLLHPEIFHYDLRAEMRKAYKSLYNYDLTDADIDGILWMDMQGGESNYAQFKASGTVN